MCDLSIATQSENQNKIDVAEQEIEFNLETHEKKTCPTHILELNELNISIDSHDLPCDLDVSKSIVIHGKRNFIFIRINKYLFKLIVFRSYKCEHCGTY